jgi:hypothetical protein
MELGVMMLDYKAGERASEVEGWEANILVDMESPQKKNAMV